MNKTLLMLVAGTAVLANATAVQFKPVPDWLTLAAGRPQIGNMHGDVAVSSKGEV